MSKFLLLEVDLKWRPADSSGYRIQMRHLPSPPTGITTILDNVNVQTIYGYCYKWWMVVHNCFKKSLRDNYSCILMSSVFGVGESCYSCFIWRRAAHFLRSLPVSLKPHPFLLCTVFQFRIQNTSWRFPSTDCTAITEEYSPCPTATSRGWNLLPLPTKSLLFGLA